jgi:hypothetical protein
MHSMSKTSKCTQDTRSSTSTLVGIKDKSQAINLNNGFSILWIIDSNLTVKWVAWSKKEEIEISASSEQSLPTFHNMLMPKSSSTIQRPRHGLVYFPDGLSTSIKTILSLIKTSSLM